MQAQMQAHHIVFTTKYPLPGRIVQAGLFTAPSFDTAFWERGHPARPSKAWPSRPDAGETPALPGV